MAAAGLARSIGLVRLPNEAFHPWHDMRPRAN